jgi:hypothetical protein
MEVIGWQAVTSGRLINRSHPYDRRDGEGGRRQRVTTMRDPGTRPFVRRMQAIDQAHRSRKWPTDKTLAKDLEVDLRTIRRDLESMRDEHQFGQPVARKRVRLDEQAASRYLQADVRVRRQAEPVENGLRDDEHYRSADSA